MLAVDDIGLIAVGLIEVALFVLIIGVIFVLLRGR